MIQYKVQYKVTIFINMIFIIWNLKILYYNRLIKEYNSLNRNNKVFNSLNIINKEFN